MKTHVITGGCGFIGSHIAEELVKNNQNKVIILDNLSSGYLKNIEHIRDKIEFINGDIRDYERLNQIMKKVDYVFHKAALVSAFDSINRPFDNHSINITGTLNVLDCASKNNVKRVILASSAAVYGNTPKLPKIETMLPSPESPYGVAKITGEYYGRVYSKLYNLSVISLRYFNVFGLRQDPSSPYSGVISIFINRILSDKIPTIFGDGTQTRDFVFIKDVVKANLLAMEKEGLSGGEVFNIATGKSISLLKLMDTINNITGKKIKALYKEAREGDIKHSKADIKKAINLLGYKPSFTLEEGLKTLIKFREKTS
ncbi:MAG TPA: SDR family oxidoreductase [Candidatus Eremiobacteraeota bacterium]|nr:MAG: UDP-glucose 4-epimerase [bacterium ADurb.Bin363]HPZ08374.1 SDR family oxidoreductase [Candidatus Eremiobacteraeota bacterium]